MNSTLRFVARCGVLGLLVALVGGCGSDPTPPPIGTTPRLDLPITPSTATPPKASPTLRKVVQKRRAAPDRKLSPTVDKAVREFERTATVAEQRIDRLPPHSVPEDPKPVVDLEGPALQAVAVWQAVHPQPAEGGATRRLEVPAYRQVDDDDCGPTAVRSVVHFHKGGDPGAVACKKAVFTNVTNVLPGGGLAGSIIGFRGFTMPSGIKIGVDREFKMPCAERRKGSVADLRHAVDQNRPPIILVRSGETLLHWLVVIGYAPGVVEVLDPGDGETQKIPEGYLVKSWKLDGDYQTGGDYPAKPGLLAGHDRVTLVINDDGPDDAGTAEFVVEQVAILGLDALQRGADPKMIGDAMNIVANAVGANTDLGKAIKAVGGTAEAIASGKPGEAITQSTALIEDLLQSAGVLPKDSGLAGKAKRAVEIASKIEDLFSRGLTAEATKLVEEFTVISKELSGVLTDPAKALGIDGAMIPALGVLQAGLKIADICRKWDQLSDLGKVVASLDGLSSAALAAQAVCSVAVCEVKGPILVLAMLLKDMIDLGINLGLGSSGDKKSGGDGPGGKGEDKPGDKPGDKPSDPSSEGKDKPGSGPAGTAAKAVAKQGGSDQEVGEAAAKAVGDQSVATAAAKAAKDAREQGEDVASAVDNDPSVRRAAERQQKRDATTAKAAADQAKAEGKPDNPAALAAAVAKAAGDPAIDPEALRVLIVLISNEVGNSRSFEEITRMALARLRTEKAATRPALIVPK